MDPLADLLDGPRARGAFLLRSRLEPPWALRIQDRSPMTVIALVEGEAWVVPDRAFPVQLAAGDVALARGPEPYTVADLPDTPPSVVIHPGQRCTTVSGEPLAGAMDLGVRTWGNDPLGRTLMLTGSYESVGEVSVRLLEALPPLVVLRRDEWRSPLLPVLADELTKDRPGQEAVLDRLLDLVLVEALRTWFSRPGNEAPRWYRALADPAVGRAVRLLQAHPDRRWTVDLLARAVGCSRATLSRRFTGLVGEPPMAFLTGCRMALAADLLRDPEVTLGQAARRTGYSTSFALSAAYKRAYGTSPRARATTG